MGLCQKYVVLQHVQDRWSLMAVVFFKTDFTVNESPSTTLCYCTAIIRVDTDLFVIIRFCKNNA